MALQLVRKWLFLNSNSNAKLSTTSWVLSNLKKSDGLPEKPRRPLTSYFRYLQDYRANIQKPTSREENLDIARTAAKNWHLLNDKQKSKYEEAYDKDKKAYLKDIAIYESTLSEDQRKQIQENKELKRITAEKKTEKKRKQETGRPKRPPTAYLLYLRQENEKNPGITATQFSKNIQGNWGKLNDKERSSFIERANELRENYKKKVTLWEERMYNEGNRDIIRTKTLANKKRLDAAVLKGNTKQTKN